MKTNKKGFTLIELLVVIAIIGLLSTIAVVSLSSARRKSRDTKRIGDVKQIQMGLEMYFDDQDGYPEELTAVVLGGSGATILCDTGFADTCAGTTYLGLVPSAPLPATDGTCTVATNPYTYTSTVDSTYSIAFCLGGKTGALLAGTKTATPAGITSP